LRHSDDVKITCRYNVISPDDAADVIQIGEQEIERIHDSQDRQKGVGERGCNMEFDN
jgi:hypothetical protein